MCGANCCAAEIAANPEQASAALDAAERGAAALWQALDGMDSAGWPPYKTNWRPSAGERKHTPHWETGHCPTVWGIAFATV